MNSRKKRQETDSLSEKPGFRLLSRVDATGVIFCFFFHDTRMFEILGAAPVPARLTKPDRRGGRYVGDFRVPGVGRGGFVEDREPLRGKS